MVEGSAAKMQMAWPIRVECIAKQPCTQQAGRYFFDRLPNAVMADRLGMRTGGKRKAG
jgi:hypothetical protein